MSLQNLDQIYCVFLGLKSCVLHDQTPLGVANWQFQIYSRYFSLYAKICFTFTEQTFFLATWTKTLR